MINLPVARLGAALFVGVAILGLSGCSSKVVIDADSAQKSVTDFVSEKTEFTPDDVKCPADTEAKVGAEFECTFTGPDGDYVAHMKITKVDGTNVLYDIETKLA